MKILLFRPRPSPETIGLQHLMLVEPLELEVLGALRGPADSVVVVDLVLERRPAAYFLERERPDVVGVTGYITNVPEMIRLCREARRVNPRVATVAGGVHCEVCPGDLDDPAVDWRVVRNATTTFPALLAHLRGEGPPPPAALRPGQAVDGSALPPLDFSYPRPDRTLTRRYRKRYFYIFHDRVALIKTAFGCPFRCNFCFCREITGGAYRERPLDEVIDELASIEEREIYIVDDDFLTSRKRVEDFLGAVEARGLDKSYLLYGRADFIARNEDVLARFKAAGLRTVIVGLESFFPEELAGYHKGLEAETNEEAMRALRRLGIDCFATLIAAPTWGPEEFAACARKLVELGVQYVNLQPLTPLPGTGFEVPAGDLLLRRDAYQLWDLAHVAVRPTRLSVADFYRQILQLYQRVLFVPRHLLRYAARYPIRMLWKMALGSRRVRRQYLLKAEEARPA